ncbi:LysR substrate-binding domain-containing protein [Cupriavidus plantarum]|uniref:LysR substrate-binding domain-containing protein n=1 Tax=Cupriavidus plantarum TaxID=942865 RepID=UPI0015CEDB78|nr:LysR substrate-binding domain-containing protein [Cupriavidus plantarum]NYI02750.1 LysR family glycine cleavage system transcriptional activator [Cupriavidus plantarum]
MRKVLPPLNPLRAFEAAARLSSFTLAAEELCVSQVAISRQVRSLEEYFGVPLFERGHRSIALTQDGARLLPTLTRALDDIAAAASGLRHRGQRDLLSIQAYTTFAQRWLIPRLTSFQKALPHIDMRLTASLRPASFEHGGLDAAIRSGQGDWPGMHADFLAPLELVPVCRPGLLAGLSAEPGEALRAVTLLHSLSRPDDWSAWLRAHGIVRVGGHDGMKFENSAMAYEAALQGAGIAIGIRVLVDGYLASGELVAPFSGIHRLDGGYYLVYPVAAPQTDAFLAFRTWLLEAATSVPFSRAA